MRQYDTPVQPSINPDTKLQLSVFIVIYKITGIGTMIATSPVHSSNAGVIMLRKSLSIPAFFALFLLAGLAHAQTGDAPVPVMEIDAETKENFVAAYSDIMEIQLRYAQQLQAVTDESEANVLQQAAQTEMQEAVTSNDLTVEEYNQVIQLASADPELMSELEAAIESMQ